MGIPGWNKRQTINRWDGDNQLIEFEVSHNNSCGELQAPISCSVGLVSCEGSLFLREYSVYCCNSTASLTQQWTFLQQQPVAGYLQNEHKRQLLQNLCMPDRTATQLRRVFSSAGESPIVVVQRWEQALTRRRREKALRQRSRDGRDAHSLFLIFRADNLFFSDLCKF